MIMPGLQETAAEASQVEYSYLHISINEDGFAEKWSHNGEIVLKIETEF